MKTLYTDMSTFIKISRGTVPVTDKVATEVGVIPMSIDNECPICKKKKKLCE
jgi:hypothetical protein